jgi:hypothetical protein
MASVRKRLTLNRETVRSLTHSEMQTIAGGAVPKPTETSHTCKTCPTQQTCKTKCGNCPCGSHHVCPTKGTVVVFRAV